MIRYLELENAFMDIDYPVPINIDGKTYFSTRAAYCAKLCKDEGMRGAFLSKSTDEIRILSKTVTRVPDWKSRRVDVMYEVVFAKFQQNPGLAERLLNTGDEEIVAWIDKGHDVYWGAGYGYGCNQYGRILMRVRSELAEAMAG